MSSLRLRYLPNLPPLIQKQALALLFRFTAAAFQSDMVRLSGLSREQCLREYARFTTERAEQALRSGADLTALRERLYRNAYRLGRAAGWLLGVRTVEDVMALGRRLYGVLDIEFDGTGSGEITISRCYFSDFYSPEVCRLMSAMDRGLLAGAAGTGDLVFLQRLTEGQTCCRARFTPAASPPLIGLREEATR